MEIMYFIGYYVSWIVLTAIPTEVDTARMIKTFTVYVACGFYKYVHLRQ